MHDADMYGRNGQALQAVGKCIVGKGADPSTDACLDPAAVAQSSAWLAGQQSHWEGTSSLLRMPGCCGRHVVCGWLMEADGVRHPRTCAGICLGYLGPRSAAAREGILCLVLQSKSASNITRYVVLLQLECSNAEWSVSGRSMKSILG